MTTLTESPTTVFAPPAGGFAPAPAEARGTARDAVRLLVADAGRHHPRDVPRPAEQLAPGMWWW